MTQTTAKTIGPDKQAASLANSGLCTLELPCELRSNESRLCASASRLLELEPVRSVSFDGRRTKVMIRLRSNRSSGAPLAAFTSQLSAQLALASEANPASPSQVVSWTDPHTQTLCFIKLPVQVAGWRRAGFVAGAAVSLVLALLGVVLPGLPTTPFVLLASYCLLRSSPALHARLLESRLFGGVLRDWHLYRGIRPHVRYKALAIIVIVVAASLLLARLPIAAMLAIAAVAACGILYVWRLPSVAE